MENIVLPLLNIISSRNLMNLNFLTIAFHRLIFKQTEKLGTMVLNPWYIPFFEKYRE